MKKNLLITALTLLTVFMMFGCQEELVKLAGIVSSKTSVTLKPEETEQLELSFFPEDAVNKEVSWSSSNNSVATVSATGLITAVDEGSCTVTATSVEDNSLSATCDVTVAWTVAAMLEILAEAEQHAYRGRRIAPLLVVC